VVGESGKSGGVRPHAWAVQRHCAGKRVAVETSPDASKRPGIAPAPARRGQLGRPPGEKARLGMNPGATPQDGIRVAPEGALRERAPRARRVRGSSRAPLARDSGGVECKSESHGSRVEREPSRRPQIRAAGPQECLKTPRGLSPTAQRGGIRPRAPSAGTSAGSGPALSCGATGRRRRGGSATRPDRQGPTPHAGSPDA
jgi:hypothetical protein